MNKFKRWLYNKFLPAWCKDDLMTANTHLVSVITEQRQEIDRLNAYIDGMHRALRRQPRINISTNGGNPEKTIREIIKEEFTRGEAKRE